MREIRAHSSLRGIAAMSVFLAHAELDRVLPAHGWWLSFYKFFYWQNPAVDLFFMLSGFVLNYVYLKHRRLEWGSYIVARLARICPLYYAGMGVMLAMNLYAVRHGQPASPNLHQPVILRNLTMTQEWPVGPSQISVILAAWSISVEMFLYLIVFPLLAKLFTGRVIPVRVILPCLLGLLVIDSLISYENIFGIVLPYARLMRGVVGFSVGFLVCELIVRRIHPWMDKG
jgi:peptidoglycan/LPS O-acetylase OafA/YrhL